jgi:DNA polymerase-3 subunit gamma/tau
MSNFVVSARKYRPSQFRDVVGQEHVTLTLKNALKNNHLAHAFLFCGPRGVGKTTCARILAKVLNCQNITANFEPCNVCDSCKSFNENASFNITELDAASNNSVEHIRSLIEQVRFQPQQGKYKVFIIDEVHMLSQQAFNAFLKTLEEPPSYAIFILATTEKHKIIPTILSRCQIFDFKRIQVQDMVSLLQNICQEEQITAEPSALHIIGQKADGALRDALSIFDRIVSFSGQHISYEDVIANLNILDYDYYFKMVDAFLLEDVASIMNTFDRILKNGFEPDIFLIGLAEHIRDLLVCKDPATLPLLEVSDDLKARFQQQAQLAPNSFLLTCLSLINDCDVNYKMARNKRLHVEIALIKMTYIHRVLSVANIGAESSAEKKNPTQQLHLNNIAVLEVQTVNEPKVDLTAAVASPAVEIAQAPIEVEVVKVPTLEELIAETEQESLIASLPSQEWTLTNVQKEWDNYATNITKDSVKIAFKNTELGLEQNTIIAKVSSELAENMIRQENGLLEQLRTAFQQTNIALNIQVDKAKVPSKATLEKPKILTQKDVLENMIQVNPLVKDFIQHFDLTLEE